MRDGTVCHDEHVLRLIEKSLRSQLFVSLYGDPDSSSNRQLKERTQVIAAFTHQFDHSKFNSMTRIVQRSGEKNLCCTQSCLYRSLGIDRPASTCEAHRSRHKTYHSRCLNLSGSPATMASGSCDSERHLVLGVAGWSNAEPSCRFSLRQLPATTASSAPTDSRGASVGDRLVR